MIRYSKQYWGLLTLTKWYGSAVLRALVFSVSSAILAGVLQGIWGEHLKNEWLHPYPYSAFAFVAGFMLVFRSNLSYGRFWEGRTQLQVLTSKLTDAAVLCVMFDAQAVRTDPSAEAVAAHMRFSDTVMHVISLLHGVALSTLREDYDLENLIVHDSLQEAPPSAAGGEVSHKESELDLACAAALATSADSVDLTGAETGATKGGDDDAGKGTGIVLAATPAGEAAPMATDGALRQLPGDTGDSGGMPAKGVPHVLTLADLQKAQQTPEQAAERAAAELAVAELAGTTVLEQHELRAYAARAHRDILSYFMLRTGVVRHHAICEQMPLSVIGGFSHAEGIALGAFATLGAHKTYDAIGKRSGQAIHGVMLDDGRYTPAPAERVHTCVAWLLELVHDRIAAGGVKVAAPIQSRIHTVLSEALTGYEQCRKLVDTPFPFPWAQAVTIVLLLFALSCPVLIAAYTTSIFTASAVTFIAVHIYFMLNEVARDVEDPFHYDPNELQLPQIQYRLNERLLAVSRTTRPTALTDVAFLSGPGNRPAMPTERQGPAQDAMVTDMPPHPLAPLAELGSQRTVSRGFDQTPRAFDRAARAQRDGQAPPLAATLSGASPFGGGGLGSDAPAISSTLGGPEYGALHFDPRQVPEEVRAAELRTSQLRRRVARQMTAARAVGRMARRPSSRGGSSRGAAATPKSMGTPRTAVTPRSEVGQADGGAARRRWREAAAVATGGASLAPGAVDAHVHVQVGAPAQPEPEPRLKHMTHGPIEPGAARVAEPRPAGHHPDTAHQPGSGAPTSAAAPEPSQEPLPELPGSSAPPGGAPRPSPSRAQPGMLPTAARDGARQNGPLVGLDARAPPQPPGRDGPRIACPPVSGAGTGAGSGGPGDAADPAMVSGDAATRAAQLEEAARQLGVPRSQS